MATPWLGETYNVGEGVLNAWGVYVGNDVIKTCVHVGIHLLLVVALRVFVRYQQRLSFCHVFFCFFLCVYVRV